MDILNADPPWSPAGNDNVAGPAARQVPAVVVGVGSRNSSPSPRPIHQRRTQASTEVETTLPEADDSLAYGRRSKTTAQELADFSSEPPPPQDWTAGRPPSAEAGGQRPRRFKALVNRIVGKAASNADLRNDSEDVHASQAIVTREDSSAGTPSQILPPSSSRAPRVSAIGAYPTTFLVRVERGRRNRRRGQLLPANASWTIILSRGLRRRRRRRIALPHHLHRKPREPVQWFRHAPKVSKLHLGTSRTSSAAEAQGWAARSLSLPAVAPTMLARLAEQPAQDECFSW